MMTSKTSSGAEQKCTDFYVGEAAPYLFPLDRLRVEQDHLTLDIEGLNDYHYQNFSKLLQIVCSMGSCSLSHRLGVNSKHYFLGEKLRIRKCSYDRGGTSLTAKSRALELSPRKGKALINIFDDSKNLKYILELDCNVFPEETFRKLLRGHQTYSEVSSHSDQLPSVQNNYAKADEFIINIGPFSEANCLGHFLGYPIVPAVFIADRVLSGIHRWLTDHQLTSAAMYVDSMEIFANRAIPVNIEFEADTSIRKLAPKTYMFISEIKDMNALKYGNYIVTVQI